jgi:hypothetical protein
MPSSFNALLDSVRGTVRPFGKESETREREREREGERER